MRGLSLIRIAARARRDRGGVATIVALLLGGGVLLGCGALAVDVGNIMWERRQLQNGADALSLALASDCMKGTCTPASVATAAMTTLNNANAADRRNGLDSARYVNGVCAHNVPGFPECGATSALWDCPPVPARSAALPYVEVHTSTVTGSGGTALPPYLSRSMGFSGETVKACARTAWGLPSGYTAQLPLTFSHCEWKTNTNNGANYQPGPVGASPGYGGAGQPAWPSVAQRVVLFVAKDVASSCYDFNGHDAPGGFGYLGNNSFGCAATVNDGGWVLNEPGNSAPTCIETYVGKVVNMPIFNCMASYGTQTETWVRANDPKHCLGGQGSNIYYHIVGWGKFYIAAVKVSGGSPVSAIPGYQPCNGSQRCVAGWFLKGSLDDAPEVVPPSPTNPGYGTSTALMAG